MKTTTVSMEPSFDFAAGTTTGGSLGPPIGQNASVNPGGQLCTDYVKDYTPSFLEFFALLGDGGWIIVVVSSLALSVILGLFAATSCHVFRFVDTKYKFTTGIVLTSYPVLGLCMFLEMLFPRAYVVLDSAAHLWFVVCMFQFFRLTISYFGGESNFVKSLEGNVLPWRGVPCCFWPCVYPCLPKRSVNKRQVKLLKFLILQHPFVQGVFSLVGFALHIEKVSDPERRFPPKGASTFISIVTTVSFLFALWAFVISFKASRMKLRKFKYCGKVASFQLTLVCFRLQSFIFNLILMPSGVFPCLPPISPKVIANLLLCSLVLGQLVILSVMANHFYRLSEADKVGYLMKGNHDEELLEKEFPSETSQKSLCI